MFKRKKTSQENFNIIASNISHELRTPLLGVKTFLSGLGDWLPFLLEEYKKALKNKEIRCALNESDLKLLSKTLHNAEKEIDYANFYLNKTVELLKNTTKSEKTSSVFSFNEAFSEGVKKYPFRSFKNPFVFHPENNDFMIAGNSNEMEAIFLYLIDNLVLAAKNAEDQVVKITVLCHKKQNEAIFTVRTNGFEQKKVKKVFKRFVLNQNLGDGLYLCEKMLINFHGRIHVNQRQNDLRFSLCFPVVK